MYSNLLALIRHATGLVLTAIMLQALMNVATHAAVLPDQAVAPNLQVEANAAPRASMNAALIASVDDRENSTPTGWWIFSGQTATDIGNFANAHNARVVDIQLEAVSTPRRFTVTYVSNTGAYGKSWWWYYDLDAATLSLQLTVNNARLISLKAYDIGGGQIRFAAVIK